MQLVIENVGYIFPEFCRQVFITKFGFFAGGKDIISSPGKFINWKLGNPPARVTLSCREKGELTSKLVLLPESIQELLDIGGRKFGLNFTKVLSKDGAEIEEIELVRDGDFLILVAEDGDDN